MYPKLAQSLFAAAAIAAAVFSPSGAHAAGPTAGDTAIPYAQATQNPVRDVFAAGARAGKFDAFTDGARIAGLDRTGVSADPARSIDPFVDGARVRLPDPYTDGAQKLAGMDTRGVSAPPTHSFNPYQDGANA
ncbi:copper resistance protein CopQ [Cupriavidus basilensis]|uniref:Copper resistance protein CopQ n=1 Tax=Cupriavidus basilensis TaxID=68895 RepID=A0ABT6AP59_9BURK|nr:copper resistance protein CopQ [Cupriavidus basilensis]MDF3834409.1 copper resistance protein CopQ [Cupriavidus basilensis]